MSHFNIVPFLYSLSHMLTMHFIMNFTPYAYFHRQEIHVSQLLLLTFSRCPALFGNVSLLLH